MILNNKIALIYRILPFRNLIKNNFSIYLSVLMGLSKYNIKLKNGSLLKINSSKLNVLQPILGVLTYATSFSIDSNNEITLKLDMNNKFIFPINDLSNEDLNLILLLFHGNRFGANFVTNEEIDLKNCRDKTLKLFQKDDKKIVETSNGVKFFVDSIRPHNTIVETFIRKIHLINSKDDWKNKIVLDVGAECGDTPLYYAEMGATVYAFEPNEENYNSMIRNLKLNPTLSKRIIPIKAAIGSDGMIDFFQGTEVLGTGGSFVKTKYGKNPKISKIKSYSLESAMKEFNINKIDLLKMDCKGCEMSLTEDSLKDVDQVKIEYNTAFSSYELDELLNKLKSAGLQCMLYSIGPFYLHVGNGTMGHVYGKKI